MQTFHLDRASAELFVVILRKTIHFTFYALVGAAGYLASSSNGGSKSTSLQSGLLSALAFASYDEFRQHSMPNREGSILDVGLDMLGAITALAIINGVSRSNRLAHKS